MPHLHLDTTQSYPPALKQEYARRIGNLYAETMQTTPDLVDVTVRELGDGSVWRCSEDLPRPAAVMSCEIRRGRGPEQRARLGAGLFALADELLDIEPLSFSVEFTQHPGDEIYRAIEIDGVVRTGFSRDWSATETQSPLLETLRAENR